MKRIFYFHAITSLAGCEWDFHLLKRESLPPLHPLVVKQGLIPLQYLLLELLPIGHELEGVGVRRVP